MKSVFTLTLLCFYLTSSLRAEQLKLSVHGETAILVNADTGTILFEKAPHQLIYPASTTKIATCNYVLKLKRDNLDETMTAEAESLGSVTQEAKRKSGYKLPAYWLEPNGTHIGIKKGETFTIRDLLAASMIATANDACNVMAMSIGGTIPKFMDQLNAYLKSIGCSKTHFLNPHGLHDPGHQTTAFDLALMGREALKEPVLCEMMMKPRYTRPKTSLQSSATYLHTNALIRPGKSYYPKAIGIKTGYHAKARSVLVAAARSEERTLVAVLTGNSDRKQMFADAIQLFEAAFNQPKLRRTFLKAGHQSLTKRVGKGNRPLATYLPSDLALEYYPAEDPQAKCQLIWHSLTLPIKKNQVVADLQLVSSTGAILKTTPLLAEEEIALSWPHSWIRKFSLFRANSPILSMTLMIMLVTSLLATIWIVIGRRGA